MDWINQIILDIFEPVISFVRWTGVIVAIAVIIFILYHFQPSRRFFARIFNHLWQKKFYLPWLWKKLWPGIKWLWLKFKQICKDIGSDIHGWWSKKNNWKWLIAPASVVMLCWGIYYVVDDPNQVDLEENQNLLTYTIENGPKDGKFNPPGIAVKEGQILVLEYQNGEIFRKRKSSISTPKLIDYTDWFVVEVPGYKSLARLYQDGPKTTILPRANGTVFFKVKYPFKKNEVYASLVAKNGGKNYVPKPIQFTYKVIDATTYADARFDPVFEQVAVAQKPKENGKQPEPVKEPAGIVMTASNALEKFHADSKALQTTVPQLKGLANEQWEDPDWNKAQKVIGLLDDGLRKIEKIAVDEVLENLTPPDQDKIPSSLEQTFAKWFGRDSESVSP